MIDYEDVLRELVLPMVDDKDSISVQKMESLNNDEILLYVYANSNDVARLIGRQGSMASAIRSMLSIASYDEHKRISIKFEALND